MKWAKVRYSGSLEKLVLTGAGYRHDRIDNNADAHLRAVLIGASEALPITQGELDSVPGREHFFRNLTFRPPLPNTT